MTSLLPHSRIKSAFIILFISMPLASVAYAETSTDGPSCAALNRAVASVGSWVRMDDDEHLTYAYNKQGVRILDYSHAGYKGGGVLIPRAKVIETVSPSGGDDTDNIQAAINRVSARDEKNGMRGAVRLSPGHFIIKGSLTISASGVVLSGSGIGTDGTLLEAQGKPRMLINLQGNGNRRIVPNTTGTIIESKMSSGTKAFHVQFEGGNALRADLPVVVLKPVTTSWIECMGMDFSKTSEPNSHWLSPGTALAADRDIESINGSRVVLDAPLTDSFDLEDTGAPMTIANYTYDGRIHNVGLEKMRVVAPVAPISIALDNFDLISADRVEDAWFYRIRGENFRKSLSFSDQTRRVTVSQMSFFKTNAGRSRSIDHGGVVLDVNIGGSQILILRSSSAGNHIQAFSTHRNAQLNVILDSRVLPESSTTPVVDQTIAPHQRWATGLLLDNVQAVNARVGMKNAGTQGSGHGWTVGFAVIWKTLAKAFEIENPPGSMIWKEGSHAMSDSDAPVPQKFKKHPSAVEMQSLYLAQLCERIGPQAVLNLGYTLDP